VVYGLRTSVDNTPFDAVCLNVKVKVII